MSGRTIYLILSLYSALAAALTYYFEPERWPRNAVLLIAVGLAVSLAAVVGQQILAAVRARRSRPATESLKPQRTAAHLDEDMSALEALRKEAMSRLSAGQGGRDGGSKSARAMFLVLGPANSGKTETLVNSGLELQLLSGQVHGDSPIVPTRVANFWLGRGDLFVELAGRLYEADQARWISLVNLLAKEPTLPWWKRLWNDAPRPVLRGVLLFHDIQCVTAQPDASAAAAHARMAQERLRAIADIFGTTVPVYAVFTKADSIKFFGEFFGKLAPAEAAEAFGFTLANDTQGAPSASMPWGEQQGRRLTKAFNIVYRRLAQRRILHLARESDAARKPDIYEFPREFRRVRSILVQMLTDAFQPYPLKPNCDLRGFYFTGTRIGEAVPHEHSGGGYDTTTGGMQGPTGPAEYGDATRIFDPDELKTRGREPARIQGSGGLGRQPVFTRQLFLQTIPKDLPKFVGGPVQPAFKKHRRWVNLALAGLFLLLAALWARSFWLNARQISSAEEAVLEVERVSLTRPGNPITTPQLRALDALRKQMVQLEARPWSMRWGLFKGDDVRGELRKVYFRSLTTALLRPLNQRIGARLARLSASSQPNPEFEPVYDRLATHLAMTSVPCESTRPAVIARVLNEEASDAGLAGDPERKSLIAAQIEFYASAMPRGAPVRLEEALGAKSTSRGYLESIRGAGVIFERILARAREKTAGTAQVETDISPVLGGSVEVDRIFTPDGWKIFEQESLAAPNEVAGDPCVLGTSQGGVGAKKDDLALIRDVRVLFLRHYKEQWKRFLLDKEFKGYVNRGDAIAKLGRLTENRSAVLGVLALASRNTFFPPRGESTSGIGQIVKPILDFGKKSGQALEKLSSVDSEDSPAHLARVFQPVQVVVPPNSASWVVDKGQAYTEALANLRQRLVDLDRVASESSDDPAVHMQAAQAADAAMNAVRSITTAFVSTGAEEVDSAVKKLLEAPIVESRKLFEANPQRAQMSGMNGALAKFCDQARPILRKYPFNPRAEEDARLDEISLLFTPQTGALSVLLQSALNKVLERSETGWIARAGVPRPRPTSTFLNFLRKAQSLSDALFARDANRPSFRYELRPSGGLPDEMSILMEFDGSRGEWNSSTPQKAFVWPASSGSAAGARAWVVRGGARLPFAGAGGTWGVFKVFRDADPRTVGTRTVQWSSVRVPGGDSAPIEPPVRMEFTRPTEGAADLLNPKFFEGFQCPSRAVE